jgi:hypothetical protein
MNDSSVPQEGARWMSNAKQFPQPSLLDCRRCEETMRYMSCSMCIHREE